MAFPNFGLRNPEPQEPQKRPNAENNWDLSVIQDIESDIKKRHGGLDPSNRSSLMEISSWVEKKKMGQMSPEEERALVTLNPKLSGLMAAIPASSGKPVDTHENITIAKQGGKIVRVGRNKMTGKDEVIPSTDGIEYFEPIYPVQTVIPGTNIPGTKLVPRSRADEHVIPKPQDPLNPKQVEDISRKVETVNRFNDIAKDFKPSYVGDVFRNVGEAKTALARRGIGDKKRSEWYQNYQAYMNEFRATQFGMTLTKFEMEAFMNASVTPEMDKDLARANIARQQAILNRNVEREKSAINKGGYYAPQVEEAFNPGVQQNTQDPLGIRR